MLQGCIIVSHFLFHIFKPVFEHWTGGQATPSNRTERQCWLLIHPCNIWESYWHALDFGCLQSRAETPFEVTEPAAEAIAYCREIDRGERGRVGSVFLLGGLRSILSPIRNKDRQSDSNQCCLLHNFIKKEPASWFCGFVQQNLNL